MKNKVESIISSEQIDDVLDAFERQWTAAAGFLIDFVESESLQRRPLVLCELVRADIDRRYAVEAEVDLLNYFESFPALRESSNLALAIAFEDYRARQSRTLSLSKDRWDWIERIHEADWFNALKQSFSACSRPAAFIRTTQSEPQLGARFGDFELIALLGVGAFSRVYLATQSTLAGRYVALKVVRKTLDEPAHLARLQHTGIVPLYSLHRIGEYSALCMPYFGSATLADWLGEQSLPAQRNGQSFVSTVQAALNQLTSTKQGTVESTDESADDANEGGLTKAEAERVRVWNSTTSQPLQKLSGLDSRSFLLWFARHVTAALAHAHERGIIHGDLKPANILLRNDGEPALIDFNLAKECDVAAPEWAGGTLPYMSPEQLQMLLGQRFQTSASADVFSLGIILFEVVENRLPFPAPRSCAEIDIEVAFEGRKNALPITNANATAGLRAIITKCIEFKPEDRYATATQVLEDIHQESSNLPLIHASESLWRSQLPKIIRRYPRLFSLVPVVAFCLLIVSLTSLLAARWWRKTNELVAKSQFVEFENDALSTLPQLISNKADRQQLLTSAVLQVKRFAGANRSAEIDLRNSVTLGRLGYSQKLLAEEAIFDYALSTAAIACETWNSLSEPERDSVRELLNICKSVRRLSDRSKVMQQLCGLAEVDWDSADLTLTTEPDAALQRLRSVEQLLIARADVLQDRPVVALQRIAAAAEFSKAERSALRQLYWLTAGDAQARLGQTEAALLSYELAIGAAPDAAISYVRRAMLRSAAKNYKAAEADLSAGIERAPKNATYYVDRAMSRERLRDFEPALRDLDVALRLNPDSNRILLMRARMNQHLGNIDGVRSDLKRGMTTEPRTVEDWISRGLAQLPRFPDRALRDLRAAEALDPDSFEVLQNIAHVQSEHLKDNLSAITTLDKILNRDPSKEMARGGRCVLLARVERFEDSLRDIEKLEQSSEGLLPATIYQIGCAHALLSRNSKDGVSLAIAYVARALKRGYGGELLESDSDLESIRDAAEFQALITASKLTSDESVTLPK